MTKSKLRKIAIILSSLAVLSGGFGIDTAHARGGGGFGGGGHIGGFGGGGFGGSHMGGFGGAHMSGGFGGDHIGEGFRGSHLGGGFGGEHIGGEFGGGHFSTGLVGDHMSGGLGGLHAGGIGESHLGLGGDVTERGAVGTDHFGAPIENHVGALAGVHPGATNFEHSRDHRRVREETATQLLCEDAIMVDPACSQTNPLSTP
jgi:hypothetical protein